MALRSAAGSPLVLAAATRALHLRVLPSLRPKPVTPPPAARPPTITAETKVTSSISRADFLTQFRSTLPPDFQEAFDRGHALPKEVRDRLLQQMPIAEQRRRGLRFSDEPVTNGPSPAEIQAMSDADAENPRRFGVNAQVVVAVLFHYADPLLLELAADMITNGVNLAFNGERCSSSPTHPARNWSLDHELLAESLQKDIGTGLAHGFSGTPPFASFTQVPLGTTPKSDGSSRIFSDYTWAGVNPETDQVDSDWLKWSKQMSHFASLGPGSCSVAWDVKSAYPSLDIRKVDRPLTCSFVPGYGWAYRRACDFGNHTVSHRWELGGGRVIQGIMDVFASITSVNDIGHFTFRPQKPAPPLPSWT